MSDSFNAIVKNGHFMACIACYVELCDDPYRAE